MKYFIKSAEDKRIIGTQRYSNFQKVCSNAGHFAIENARARGLPLTYVEDNKIVLEYSDGKKVIIGKIEPRINVKKRIFKLR